MKRTILTAVLMCLFGFSGPTASADAGPAVSDPYVAPQARPAVDADGNLLFTSVTPPAGLVVVNPAVDADGVLAATNVTPPAGLVVVNPAVDSDGVLAATNVTPPAGLVVVSPAVDSDGVLITTNVPPLPGFPNPVVRFDSDTGGFLVNFKPPALSVTGALVLMALMLILGGYALVRYRRVQVP